MAAEYHRKIDEFKKTIEVQNSEKKKVDQRVI